VIYTTTKIIEVIGHMTSKPPHPKIRKRSGRRAIVNFFRDNMVEIVAVLLLLGAGILYLLFSENLTNTPRSPGDWLHILSQFIQNLRDRVMGILTGPSLPDILIGSILAFVFVLVLLRIRYRLLHSRIWNSRSCPRCGEYIQRVHRKQADRYLVPIILPHARRYRCPKCEWEGLRRGSIARPPA
jgi:predicted RNA-binding Zn-ribbon protein involved in translation (DUF1610 family)